MYLNKIYTVLLVFSLAVTLTGKDNASFIKSNESLFKNCDFENDLNCFKFHKGKQSQIIKCNDGFESQTSLEIVVPANEKNRSNYIECSVDLPQNLSTRHFRGTWWMQVKDLKGGGAGLKVIYLDKKGNELGTTKVNNLYSRSTKINKWQKIDYLKDRWWQSYEMEFDVPNDCKKLKVCLGLFKASGKVIFDRVLLNNTPSVKELAAINSSLGVEINPKIMKTYLHPMLFTANVEYLYKGIEAGTLSENNPENKRKEFARVLKEAGIKVLRFPGGMPAHKYFVEGKKYQRELVTKLIPSMTYYYSRFPRSSYPKMSDVLRFCRDYGFDMLFQTNCLFYVDKSGKIHAITRNHDVKKNEKLYDRDRVKEAGQALAKFIDLIPKGCKIKYWEIGNEEFALMSVDDYSRIAAEYIQVIKKRIPDAFIIVTGNVWPVKLCQNLEKFDVIDDVDYISVHYPWGAHWQPEKGKENSNIDVNRFVMGELNWDLNIRAHKYMLEKAGFPKIKLAGSETNVFKFHAWKAGPLIYTPAQALLLAHNWIEAMKVNNLDVLAYHDLESPYFGMILYDAYFNSKNNEFKFIPPDMTKCPANTPQKYFLKNKYLVLPSGKVMKMLSEHSGLNVLKNIYSTNDKAIRRNIDIISSQRPEGLLITLVNRAKSSRKIIISYDKIMKNGTCHIKTLYWNKLRELPGTGMSSIKEQKSANSKIEVLLKPLSVTQIKINKR